VFLEDLGYSVVAAENGMDACNRDTAEKQKQVIFGVKQNPDHILFEITDTGTCMDRETREKLFTLFFPPKASRALAWGCSFHKKSSLSMAAPSTLPPSPVTVLSLSSKSPKRF